jgi:O-6-methylguanine DNA methyltransferase
MRVRSNGARRRRQPNGALVVCDTGGTTFDKPVGGDADFALPLDLRGTDFQRRVWDALLAIPYGETRSYAEIARGIREPAAVRAVGAANGANPCSIVVPCHRVVATGGKLGGYGGGLPLKRKLLALEHANPLDGDLL